MAHLYEVGTRAWQPDPTEGWVASELVSKTSTGDKYNLVFKLANGQVRLLSPEGYPLHSPVILSMLTLNLCIQTKTVEATADALSLPNNPDLPPLMNPTMLEASDDLTNLSHLNEPAGMTLSSFLHNGTDRSVQSSKPSGCDIRKRRYIRTVVLSS
jgi:myosin-5